MTHPHTKRIHKIDVKTTSNNTEDNQPAKSNHGPLTGRTERENGRAKVQRGKCTNHENSKAPRKELQRKPAKRWTEDRDADKARRLQANSNFSKTHSNIHCERTTAHYKEQKEGRAESGTAEIRKGR